MKTTDDSWDLSPGDVIAGHCIVQELLGGGRNFEVFAAFDADRLCPVVVKALRPGRATDPRNIDGLRREIELVGRLNHPGLVRGFHASLEPPRPYLCLENVFGPRLSTAIRDDGPLDIAVAASLTLEMSSVLHYMHSQYVVHLDVTPANVILGSPARLIDLSLARSVEEAASSGSGAGTRGFQAPELLDPQSPYSVGPWSDIWSLGATIHVGLTGRRVSDALSLPAVVPVALRELIDAMLAEEPSSRPTAAAVFDVADALLEDMPSPRIDFFHPQGRA